MKKRVLLFTAVAGLAFITLSSYDNGPAMHNRNYTGAKGGTASCGGAGCHGGNDNSTTVTIFADSTGTIPVNSYVPGMTYNILIIGANSSLLPEYGFQFASVTGTGGSQIQAGTFTTLPANVHTHTYNGINFVEHSQQLQGAAGVYQTSFNWTAPAAGSGTVTMYCTLNAVDGNGNENSADRSNNTTLTLTEQVAATAVASVNAKSDLKVYPNPVSNSLQLTMSNAKAGQYTINVFDLSGKTIATERLDVNGGDYSHALSTGNWAKGIYLLQLLGNGITKVTPIEKK